MLLWAGLIIGLLLGLIGLVTFTALQHVWARVPYVPTSPRIVHAMVEAAKLKPGERVYDLGAGDARLLIAAKEQEPRVRAVGYELAVAVWLLGRLRLFLSGVCADLRLMNFLREDCSRADVVFLYLSPWHMRTLIPKFDRELRPGTRVISHAFRFPGRRPARVQEVKLPLWGKRKIYLYVW